MRILVTRPAEPVDHTTRLCEKLHALGFSAEFFPTLVLHPTQHPTTLHNTIKNLNTTDIAIFVSQAAVHFSLPAIHSYWDPIHERLPTLQWMSIGPATKKTLQQFNIQRIFMPSIPPYESESLLAIEPLQPQFIRGKKIILFRGNQSRPLLFQTLQERGAIVQGIECYQGIPPNIDNTRMMEKMSAWRQTPFDAIITTSRAGLTNLVSLIKGLGTEESSWFKAIPIVVVGLRMFELANTLEFKKPILATGADDASLLAVLNQIKGTGP